MAANQEAMTLLVKEIIRIAKAEIGVREVGNTNCGVRMNQYKAATWLNPKVGWAWCAAFVCWVVREAMASAKVKQTETFKRPRTAAAWDFINWSLAQDNSTSTLRNPKGKDIAAGDIVVYTFSHIGIAISGCGANGKFEVAEGNTDDAGSREGGGVYAKVRDINQVRARIRFRV
jgi:hypothetical protein